MREVWDSDHIARILEQWDHELPDVDTAPIAVAGRILRAARYLEREIDRELATFGLSVHAFNALSALRRSGPHHELTPTALSHALLFTSGGLSKLLERLERSGLVRRERATADRRVTVVCLTERGRDLQERALHAHLRNEEGLLASLTDADRKAIADILRRLLAAFEDADPRPRRSARAVIRAGAGSWSHTSPT
jgi:DNA-binding MarR family transcriptional regulator